MKTVKIISFTLFVCAALFLGYLRDLAELHARRIEKNFVIAVALNGTLASEVVADRILALDGVAYALRRGSEEIFQEYKNEKIISEKIRLEQNPFMDYIVVTPDSMSSDIALLAEKIRASGGVEDVSYDPESLAVFSGLKSVSRKIALAAAAFVGAPLVLVAALVAAKVRSKVPKPQPYLYFLLPAAVVCGAAFLALYRRENMPFDYFFNAAGLAVAVLAASLAYAE